MAGCTSGKDAGDSGARRERACFENITSRVKSSIYFPPRSHNNSTLSQSFSNSTMLTECGGRAWARSSIFRGTVLIWVFVLLTNVPVKLVASDPVVGGHHGGTIETQLLLQQPTIGATNQQEDEPFLLNEIEEDVHCKFQKPHIICISACFTATANFNPGKTQRILSDRLISLLNVHLI